MEDNRDNNYRDEYYEDITDSAVEESRQPAKRRGPMITPEENDSKDKLLIALIAVMGVLIALLVLIIILMHHGVIGGKKTNQETSQNSGTSQEIIGGESQSGQTQSEDGYVTLNCGAKISVDATAADLSDYEVDSLAGIEKVTGLSVLKIDGGTLTDLSPLKGLPLQSLTLNNVPVYDLSALESVSTLTYLNIKDTSVGADAVKALKAANAALTVEGYSTMSYKLVEEDVTWDQANAAAQAAGGILAVVDSEETFGTIKQYLRDHESGSLVYVWLGAYRDEGGTWHNCDGTEGLANLTSWYPGEPSGKDTDGTVEDKLCVWDIDENGWTLNDQRGDLSEFEFALGHIGYLMQIEEITGSKS